MDQHHNDNSSTKADPRAEFYKRLLDECEWAWCGGNLPAVVDAMKYCAEANMPPPPWLIDANATLVSRQMLVRTGHGAFNSPQKVFEENQKHYLRWDMVNELLECGGDLYKRFGDDSGLTIEKARAAVSEKLKRTVAKGGEDAVKYSYDLVEQKMAEGHGAEFYITRFKPNEKSG